MRRIVKQLSLTPQLIQLIKDRVGPDTATDGIAVFEAIALNTKPLPGKNGSLHEQAKVAPITLRQMADSIRGGNHLPLVSDHQLMGEPKGRIFDADLHYEGNGELELRVLFYLDSTEDRLIAKLNSASLDEVSVSFMPTAFLCSECGWDYFDPDATSENFYERTCANGHTIGENGVHADLVGLSEFIEVSLVARGAADKPKIVGKSESKLAPVLYAHLAAQGFDTNGLVVRASKGVESVNNPDLAKLVTDLTDAKASAVTLSAERDSAKTAQEAAEAEVEELKAKLAAAEAVVPEGSQEALDFVTEAYTKLATAAGKEGDAPTAVADLISGIRDLTTDLTAIIPVGGVSNPSGSQEDTTQRADFGAFKVNR